MNSNRLESVSSGSLARTGSSFRVRRPRIANGPLFRWRSSEPRHLTSHWFPVCPNSVLGFLCLQVYQLQCTAKCEDLLYICTLNLNSIQEAFKVTCVFGDQNAGGRHVRTYTNRCIPNHLPIGSDSALPLHCVYRTHPGSGTVSPLVGPLPPPQGPRRRPGGPHKNKFRSV